LSSPPTSVSRVRLKSIVALGLSSVLLASGLVTGAQQSALANGACTSGTTSTAFSGGNGQSAATAWEIATASDLIRLSEITASSGGVSSFRDDYYKQTTDIDLAGCDWTPIGSRNAGENFTGTYNGLGHEISGLYINHNPRISYAGLFGHAGPAAVIENLKLTDVDITSGEYVGGAVGFVAGAHLRSVSVSGVVSGAADVGGLVGLMNSGSITNAVSTASVRGQDWVGVVGNPNRVIKANPESVGGLIGDQQAGSFANSYSIGLVTDTIGGGTLFGGLSGGGSGGSINNSFWNTTTSGQSDSRRGTGKTTDELKTLSTFNDDDTVGLTTAWAIVDGWEAFDFDSPTNYWGICPLANDGYPFLLWEYTDDPCTAPQVGGSDNSGGTGGGEAPAAAVTAAPPAPAPAPQRAAPRAPVTPPVALEGPVLRTGGAPVPPQVPGAFIGGVPIVLQQTVPDSTRLSLATGSVALDMTVANGSGASSTDGATQLGVKNRSSIELAGSGLLPGSTVQVFIPLTAEDSRELAQLVVNPDGTFSGAAAFSSDPLADPLPIGPRLLQLVTIDEDGNQVVLEMTVAIEQGDPNPELNRELGDIPTMPVGSLEATSAGLPVEANITAIADEKLAVVEGDGWTMAVNIDSPDGAVEETEAGAVLKLVRDETALVSGSGFMSGTRADVWLFSEPTLVGTVSIDENGEFTGEVDIDPNLIPAGEHTLQLQGVGTDGYVKAANLGVLVEDAGATPSVVEESSFSWTFLWWILLVIVALLILWFVVRRRRQGSHA
jgi:hypothetical protein